MKKYIVFGFLMAFSFSSFSQEEENRMGKYYIGLSAVSSNYIGLGINTPGFRLDAGVNVFEDFSAGIGFSKFASYFDYCGEIPVQVDEVHFTPTLSYTFLEKGRWRMSAVAGFDFELTSFKEISALPENASVFHEIRVHEEDHNEQILFVEGLFGLDIDYKLSDRLFINVSSRLNTYGALHSSVGLRYNFHFKKREDTYFFR